MAHHVAKKGRVFGIEKVDGLYLVCKLQRTRLAYLRAAKEFSSVELEHHVALILAADTDNAPLVTEANSMESIAWRNDESGVAAANRRETHP